MLLKKGSSDSKKYICRNKSFFPDSTLESIKIKDNPDVYEFTVYTTLAGLVISNLGKNRFYK